MLFLGGVLVFLWLWFFCVLRSTYGKVAFPFFSSAHGHLIALLVAVLNISGDVIFAMSLCPGPSFNITWWLLAASYLGNLILVLYVVGTNRYHGPCYEWYHEQVAHKFVLFVFVLFAGLRPSLLEMSTLTTKCTKSRSMASFDDDINEDDDDADAMVMRRRRTQRCGLRIPYRWLDVPWRDVVPLCCCCEPMNLALFLDLATLWGLLIDDVGFSSYKSI